MCQGRGGGGSWGWRGFFSGDTWGLRYLEAIYSQKCFTESELGLHIGGHSWEVQEENAMDLCLQSLPCAFPPFWALREAGMFVLDE